MKSKMQSCKGVGHRAKPGVVTGNAVLAAFVLNCVALSCALAQPSNLRIGFIDADTVMASAPQTQAAIQELQDQFAPRVQDLEKLKADLDDNTETYNRDSSVMSDDERAKLEREIRDQQREFDRQNKTLQEDVDLARNEKMQGVQTEISKQIAMWASNQGYDLILQNAVFRNPRVDVTQDVVDFLNKGSDAAGKPAAPKDE